MNYWEAVAVKEVLLQKLNDELFVPAEWITAINEIQQAGFENMAGDLQRRCEHYANAVTK